MRKTGGTEVEDLSVSHRKEIEKGKRQEEVGAKKRSKQLKDIQ
jgi:hypothetical protein